MQLFLAAASANPTVLQKVQAVPMSTWISCLIAVIVIVVLVRVWKTLQEFNEFAPWIALFMLGGSVVLYWTYERTEPKVLSPIFDVLAQYLPSKIQYKDAPGMP
jgi:chromate transport protein ChrA